MRSKPYMQNEWKKLASFTRNGDLADLARGILKATPHDERAKSFSAFVNTVRNYRWRMARELQSRK